MMSRKTRLLVIIAGAGLVTLTAAGVIGGCRVDYGDLGTGGDFLVTGRTRSTFTAIQVDPRSEDSAGPQFVVAEDLDGDGLLDLISAWNQSQPVQLHLQRRTAIGAVTFETVTLAGNIPAVAVAGLAVTDFDRDSDVDIAVLLKESLLADPQCIDSELPVAGLSGLILLYLGPDDSAQVDQALAWEEVEVGNSFLQGAGSAAGEPESGGYSAMAVGDMDGDGDMDIVAAWNSNCGENGSLDVLLFTNGGPAAIRNRVWTVARIPDPFPKGTIVKDVALGDIDRDGDLDIVATFPDAPAMNVRWYRNPSADIPDDFHVSNGAWQTGTVAQIATGADVVELADIDRDGIADVLVRSTGGAVLQWLKGPDGPTTSPVRSIPWQVYTLAEFTDRVPAAMGLGDLDFDGQLEVVASIEGGLVHLASRGGTTVYDQWAGQVIIDDQVGGAPTTDPNVNPGQLAATSFINTIRVIDLDGDGANDLVVTLDRSGLSGLTNDALVWFRNTLTPP